MTRTERGFTLLEILVVLVVFGLLMTCLLAGIRFGLSAWDKQTQNISRNMDLDAIDRTIRAMAANMDSGSRMVGLPYFQGNSRSARFITMLPIANGGLASQRADVLLHVDSRHRLLLQWAPHYQTLAGPPPLPRDDLLLADVDHIELSYWLPTPTGGRWVDQWAPGSLPDLLRVRIIFLDRDSREWPDIVSQIGAG